MVGGAQRFISARLLARSPCAAALAWPTRSLVVTGSVHQLLGDRDTIGKSAAYRMAACSGSSRVECGANWEAARPLVPSRVQSIPGSRPVRVVRSGAEPSGKLLVPRSRKVSLVSYVSSGRQLRS